MDPSYVYSRSLQQTPTRQHRSFIVQVIRSWRTTIAPEGPADLLARHGIRTLLFAGASVCGKLVRISYPRNVHQQLEAAALASALLAAILPSSLSHPQRAIDTAAYTPVHIGTDQEGDSAVSGKDVFRDPYELNLPDVLLGLEAVSRTLVNSGVGSRMHTHVLWSGEASMPEYALCVLDAASTYAQALVYMSSPLLLECRHAI